MNLFLFIVLLVLMFSGVPVYLSLCFSSLLTLMFFTNIDLMMVVQRLLGGVDKFALLSVPFFILGANVMKTGGIGVRIIGFAKAIVGGYRGGMAYTTEVASMFFGAVSGSSPATVVAIGGLMYPALKEHNYESGFSAGLIASSGSVALLIPPSVTAIIYASLTGASVGALFIAGLGAGIVYGLCFIVHCFIYATKNKIKVYNKYTWKDKLYAIKEAAWALGVPIIIVGGIYGGICTPTEAAGISTVYAILVSVFIYREMNWDSFQNCMKDSVKTTAQVMILIASASLFAWLLTIGQMPQNFTRFIISLNLSPLGLIGVICVFMLIAGCFIDGSSAMLIIMPLVAPVVRQMGIDMVYLGIVFITTVAIGMFTPPFGLNLFVAKSITGASMTDIFKGVLPFVVVSLVALILIVLFPEISLFLPRLFYGLPTYYYG